MPKIDEEARNTQGGRRGQGGEPPWGKENPGMTLDHIVPITPPMAFTLGGKPANWRSRSSFVGPLIPIVYGFQQKANWAPLPFHENARKGNRDWPDSPWS